MNLKGIKKYYQMIGILGIGSILVYLLDLEFEFLNDYLKGFFISFGSVLIIFSIFANVSKKFILKKEISANDERLIMLQQKSLSIGFLTHKILTVFGIIIFGIFEQTYIISIVLAAMLFVESISIWIAHYIYRKTY